MVAPTLPFKIAKRPKKVAKRRKCVECGKVDAGGMNAPRSLIRDGNRYRYKKARWLCSGCSVPVWEKYLSDVKERMVLIWLSSILGYPATSKDVLEYRARDTEQVELCSNVKKKRKKVFEMKWVFKGNAWVATLKRSHKAQISWNRDDPDPMRSWLWEISKKGKVIANGSCGSRSQAETSLKITANDLKVG